jgi:hypothetical protein
VAVEHAELMGDGYMLRHGPAAGEPHACAVRPVAMRHQKVDARPGKGVGK